MESILPILACLAWLCTSANLQAQVPQGNQSAQPAGQQATGIGGDSTSGNALLRHVSTTLNNQPSIAAKVRQKVDLLGQGLFGSGIYLQQGRGPTLLLRFDLTLQTAAQPSMVQ